MADTFSFQKTWLTTFSDTLFSRLRIMLRRFLFWLFNYFIYSSIVLFLHHYYINYFCHELITAIIALIVLLQLLCLYSRSLWRLFSFLFLFQVHNDLGITDHVWQEKHAAVAATVDHLCNGFVLPCAIDGGLCQKAYIAGAVPTTLALDRKNWSSMSQLGLRVLLRLPHSILHLCDEQAPHQQIQLLLYAIKLL